MLLNILRSLSPETYFCYYFSIDILVLFFLEFYLFVYLFCYFCHLIKPVENVKEHVHSWLKLLNLIKITSEISVPSNNILRYRRGNSKVKLKFI